MTRTIRFLFLMMALLPWVLTACGDSPFEHTPYQLDDDDGSPADDDDADDDDDDASEECDGVTCGDNAHCEADECVCDDGFEGDPYEACEPYESEEARIRQELVDIATAELGFCEGTDERPYMEQQPGQWCYDFVAWVYSQADEGLPAPINLPQMYIDSMPDDWRPAAGDLIKYNIQHYGMVASLSEDEITVYTLEGNVNYCVMERSTTDVDVSYYGTLEDWMASLN